MPSRALGLLAARLRTVPSAYKGKDERGIGYVKRNAITGHEFASGAALEAHLERPPPATLGEHTRSPGQSVSPVDLDVLLGRLKTEKLDRGAGRETRCGFFTGSNQDRS